LKLNAEELKVEQMKEEIQKKVIDDPGSAADILEKWVHK